MEAGGRFALAPPNCALRPARSDYLGLAGMAEPIITTTIQQTSRCHSHQTAR